MLYEHLIAQREMEQQARQEGFKHTLEFLNRLVGPENIAKPEYFVELLRGLNYDQFVDLLKRVNGLVANIPIKERAILEHESGIVTNFMGSSSAEIVPPIMEARTEILQDTFTKLKELIDKDIPDIPQYVARTLFNAIIYLHLFADSNGRTARLCYFLFSPHVQKDPVNLPKHIEQVVATRPQELKIYHHQQNMGYFFYALHERDIGWDYDKERRVYCAHLEEEDSPWHPFDFEQLGYLAVNDVLTEEEKVQYGHACSHGDVNFYVIDELPTEIRAKMNQRRMNIRSDFSKFIIDISVDPEEEWPDFVQGPLDHAFEYKEDIVTE